MRYDKLTADLRLRQELLERFDALKSFATPKAGFEGGGADTSPTVDDARRALDTMAQGKWSSADDKDGLEAIILRFTRPVYLVQDNTFRPPIDKVLTRHGSVLFPESEEIWSRLAAARVLLERAIPSIGRLDITNHRLTWLGTGWMVKPNVLATNRHVAAELARPHGAGFAFRKNKLKDVMSPSIDWLHEHERKRARSIFQITRVLWMEPDDDDSPDVALLEVKEAGRGGQAQPETIQLASAAEIKTGGWFATIGYPAEDSRCDAADQQRIFDGIYDVKRLSPGTITSVHSDGLLMHDATTLGGSSGSALIALDSGKALALHFGGLDGVANFAIPAPLLQAIVDAHT